MTSRRDLLIGAACLAASAAAYALTPRRHFSLLGERRLDDVTPIRFGAWSSTDVSGLVAPATEGSLTAKLYAETLERVYANAATGSQVMMLFAHGDSQTNELQLHRPEVCYPAFGFQIAGDRTIEMPLASGVTLPARRLIADAPGRRENIVYWTRLGEFLPIDSSQQRVDRIKTALHGVVADGLLGRVSVLGEDPSAAFTVMQTFIPELIRATAPSARSALIGTERSRAMMEAGVYPTVRRPALGTYGAGGRSQR